MGGLSKARIRAKEVALKIKAEGIGPSLILKITGLSMEEIEKL